MKIFLRLLTATLTTLALVILQSCTTYTLDESQVKYVSLNTSLKSGESNDKSNNKSNNENIINFSPIVKLFDAKQAFNKIGTPSVNDDGKVFVSSEQPSFYTRSEKFTVEGREYTNLIYRVHFSKAPFSIFPFHFSTGKNVGLFFIITLNTNQQPVLITAVHSCGCYKVIIATNHTPRSAFPENLPKEEQKVYGEKLPSIITLNKDKPDVCIAVRPLEHRVMDVYSCDKSKHDFEPAQNKMLSSLRELPSKNGPVSFFHEKGFQEGYVKGAIKPWETLIVSWPSLDLFPGRDKALLQLENSDNHFYTSLKPWRREISDMADFPTFLNYWGWKL